MPRNQSIRANDADILLSANIGYPLSTDIATLFRVSEMIAALECPLFSCRISAGFPSPASDYVEKNLDLNQLMVHSPASTFYVRVAGDSMMNAGIVDGDYLVVGRSLQVSHSVIVIARINGGLTVERFFRQGSTIELRPENTAYPPILIQGETELLIWGVVTGVVRKTR